MQNLEIRLNQKFLGLISSIIDSLSGLKKTLLRCVNSGAKVLIESYIQLD